MSLLMTRDLRGTSKALLWDRAFFHWVYQHVAEPLAEGLWRRCTRWISCPLAQGIPPDRSRAGCIPSQTFTSSFYICMPTTLRRELSAQVWRLHPVQEMVTSEPSRCWWLMPRSSRPVWCSPNWTASEQEVHLATSSQFNICPQVPNRSI